MCDRVGREREAAMDNVGGVKKEEREKSSGQQH